MDYISHFTTDFRHISSHNNVLLRRSRVLPIAVPITHGTPAPTQDVSTIYEHSCRGVHLYCWKNLIPDPTAKFYCDI
jgi:hypothetical protein